MKRFLAILLVLFLAACAGLAVYVRGQLQRPGSPASGLIVQIPRGMSARDVVGLLEDKNVIPNEYAALAYISYTGTRNKLQAGEYLFDRPMTIPEVIHKLVSGSVYLRKFMVPEGLTIKETAKRWEEQGFGKAGEFLAAAGEAVELVRTFDEKASSVEGYLFPETYSFPTQTTARQAVDAMITRFRQVLQGLEQKAPATAWPLGLRQTVILASLIETEAKHEDERPIISSVYLNRLNKRILLQCDPTVIYALELANKYRGTLTLADLKFKSPYNTYLNAGLPPGPIANPGYGSLLAAVQPASTKYLFFVRTVESRHTFSETLAAHNRAVSAYRKSRARNRS